MYGFGGKPRGRGGRGRAPWGRGGRHGGRDPKVPQECLTLSPCFNDNLSEGDVASAGASDATQKKIAKRMERIDDMMTWYEQLSLAMDVNLMGRLLTDSGRVLCVHPDVRKALGEMRKEMEHVDHFLLPQLHKKKLKYDNTFQMVKKGSDESTFKDETEPEASLDDRPDAIIRAWKQGTLSYRRLLLLTQVDFAHSKILQKIKGGELPPPECGLPEHYDALHYLPSPRDRFFLTYVCSDGGVGVTRMTYGFSINGGQPQDIKVEPLPVHDGRLIDLTGEPSSSSGATSSSSSSDATGGISELIFSGGSSGRGGRRQQQQQQQQMLQGSGIRRGGVVTARGGRGRGRGGGRACAASPSPSARRRHTTR